MFSFYNVFVRLNPNKKQSININAALSCIFQFYANNILVTPIIKISKRKQILKDVFVSKNGKEYDFGK